MTETVWSTKPKTFPSRPFTEIICAPITEHPMGIASVTGNVGIVTLKRCPRTAGTGVCVLVKIVKQKTASSF